MPEAGPRIAQDIKYTRPTNTQDSRRALGLAILGTEVRKKVEGANPSRATEKVPQNIIDFAAGVARRAGERAENWRDEAAVNVRKVGATEGQQSVDSFGTRDKKGKLKLTPEEEKLKAQTENNRRLYIEFVNGGFDNLADDPPSMKLLPDRITPNPNWRDKAAKQKAMLDKIKSDLSQNPRLKDIWLSVEGDPVAEKALLERIAQDRRYQAKVGEGLSAVKDGKADRSPAEDAREEFEDAKADLKDAQEEAKMLQDELDAIKANPDYKGLSMTALRDAAQLEVNTKNQVLASLRAEKSASQLVVNMAQPANNNGPRVISRDEMNLIDEVNAANKKLADATRYIQLSGKGEGSIHRAKRAETQADRKRIKAEQKQKDEDSIFKKAQENLASNYDQVAAQAVEAWVDAEANEFSPHLNELIAQTEDPRTKAVYEGFKSHWQKKNVFNKLTRQINGRLIRSDFNELTGSTPPTAEQLLRKLLSDGSVINPDKGRPYKLDSSVNPPVDEITDRLQDKAWVDAVAPQVVVEIVRRMRSQRRLSRDELTLLNTRYPGVWDTAVSRDHEMAAKVATEAAMMREEGVDKPTYLKRVGNLIATNPGVANRYLQFLNSPAQFLAVFSALGQAVGQSEEQALEAQLAAEEGLIRQKAA